jgi:hypothetical protein
MNDDLYSMIFALSLTFGPLIIFTTGFWLYQFILWLRKPVVLSEPATMLINSLKTQKWELTGSKGIKHNNIELYIGECCYPLVYHDDANVTDIIFTKRELKEIRKFVQPLYKQLKYASFINQLKT